MDTTYTPSKFEEEIYRFWEQQGFFKASVTPKKKPFSIILPPPNANAALHIGHAMYVYEDVMIRYKRLRGYETLWLPGADHAGIETQYVFEKHLRKQGKSRFDYDRETLFKMIWDFVAQNRGVMESQLRNLGFALDWSKEKYTMDPDIVKTVHESFKRLYDEGLVYRANRLVNYCTRDGTSFADLEVVTKEQKDPLYFMKYGPFVLATVRPETKFGDTAVAVNPKDKRYQKYIGQEVEVRGLIGTFKMKVVSDTAVDPKFGTGVVKVTPAHDFNDFEIAKRHNLPMKQVIGFDGKLNEHAGKYQGLKVAKAREIIAEDLKKAGLLVDVKEDYTHVVGTCYRCGNILEPLPLEQWYINVKPLVTEAKKLITKEKIKIYPKRFKKRLLQILTDFIDWNISRQIVWGIRIPAYRCRNPGSQFTVHSSQPKTAKEGRQQPSTENREPRTNNWFVSTEKPDKCELCGKCDFEQDPDTFDTWFSSSQWPFATLQAISKSVHSSQFTAQNSKRGASTTVNREPRTFFDYFYPTSVMETGYDILRAWVARMIMMGSHLTGRVPFETIFTHGLVRDKHGAKMSKSRGNVINPLEMVEKYGADAFRASLLFNIQEGADLSLSQERVIGMRNFANKIWNIGRFIDITRITNNELPVRQAQGEGIKNEKQKTIEKLEKEFTELKKEYLRHMEAYRFSKALGLLHEFLWHRFADVYIEELKTELKNGNIRVHDALQGVYLGCLTMLHPFMPFVTEVVWQVFKGENDSILNAKL